MPKNNYHQALSEMMDILEKYDIQSDIILLSGANDFQGHIFGSIKGLAYTLERGADLKNATAIDCRKFITEVSKIKL